jgi:hypothetical protein
LAKHLAADPKLDAIFRRVGLHKPFNRPDEYQAVIASREAFARHLHDRPCSNSNLPIAEALARRLHAGEISEILPPQIGAVAVNLVSASIGDIAVVFLRSPAHEHYSYADRSVDRRERCSACCESDRRSNYPDPLLQAFSETGEPIFRRSIMRLGIPRIESLQTDDGTASITFLGVDTNRDTTGGVYLFQFKTPSGDIEVNTTVGTVTSFPASDKFFAETGNKLMDLTLTDIRKYIETYAEEYGNTLKVALFTVPANTSGNDIVVLRDAFCALFFEYWSSYKYNNADVTSDPADRYPDTINFVPYDLDRKFHVTLHARQGGRHD